MEQFENVSKEMKKLLDKAEEMDWSSTVWKENYHQSRTYVELEKYSPAGEDFSMIIDFDEENQAESLTDNLREYAESFDADEHATMWIENRKSAGGVPQEIRELIDDADAIHEMIEDLADAMEEADLTDEQVGRIDEIYNSVFDLCKVMCEDNQLEWNMGYIGEIADFAANTLTLTGKKVRFPAIIETEDGKQKVVNYHNEEE